MELIGTHTINASAQQIWDMLMDSETLAKITPGISKLEVESEGIYKALADVKMGPVNGKFEGRVQVLDAVAPESFTLKVQQNSSIGNVSADIKMLLKALNDNQTELSFDGKAAMSGLLARTGNRVMSGVANTLTKQFFDNFEKELALVPVPAPLQTATPEASTPIPSAQPETQSVGFLQKIINWFMSLFK